MREKDFKVGFDKLKLSARAHDRILKVARTIADLEESPIIQAVHCRGHAIRSLDRTVLGLKSRMAQVGGEGFENAFTELDTTKCC